MEQEETKNNENKFSEKPTGTPCCCGPGMSNFFSQCCEDMKWPSDCRSMMAECMKKCRWFLLIPVLFGVLFLLLGYVLDAEVTRTLWMAAAGVVIVMGAFGFLMMSMCRKKRG